MAQHNFTRRTFTALAELIGDVESGKVNPSNVRAEVIARFELGDQPDFKEDKFARHADTQREFNRKPASMLQKGDTFCYNGLVLIAHEVHRNTEPFEAMIVTTRPDNGLGNVERHSTGEPVRLAFYPDELV